MVGAIIKVGDKGNTIPVRAIITVSDKGNMIPVRAFITVGNECNMILVRAIIMIGDKDNMISVRAIIMIGDKDNMIPVRVIKEGWTRVLSSRHSLEQSKRQHQKRFSPTPAYVAFWSQLLRKGLVKGSSEKSNVFILSLFTIYVSHYT